MENQNLEMFASSPEVAKLFEALAKAQAEMKPAVMDMKNPHFNSRYASLTACQDAYRAPLSKHSLAVTQQVFSVEDKFYIRSVLGHSSGQWISNVFRLIIDRQNMQGLGSAITYGRRYGVNALIGIVDTEDDDGNAAVGPQAPKNSPAKTQAQLNIEAEQARKRKIADDALEAAKKRAMESKPPVLDPVEQHDFNEVMDAQPDYETPPRTLLEELVAFAGEKQISADQMKEIIKRVVGVPKKSTELNDLELQGVLKYLRLMKK